MAVVGAGIAGSATAIGLARAGVEDICLIGSAQSRRVSVGESIPPDTRPLLQHLGLWDDFARQAHQPCMGSCSAWSGSQIGYNDFVTNPYGNGWHLDRKLFERLLTEEVSRLNIRQLDDTQLLGSCALAEGGVDLNLMPKGRKTENFAARFVVDATGTGSIFARSTGARPQPLDHLCCIYGYFDDLYPDERNSGSTLLEAVEDGWWYLAKLPGDRVAVAFATDPQTLRDQGLRQYEQWMATLLRTSLIASRLDGYKLASQFLSVHPAPSFLLDHVSGRDWLAVGDAASCYDPIVAQGIYKALSTAVSAAEVISNSFLLGDDTTPEYDVEVKADFNAYLRNRNYLYEREQRWPEASFWKRRHIRTEIEPRIQSRTALPDEML